MGLSILGVNLIAFGGGASSDTVVISGQEFSKASNVWCVLLSLLGSLFSCLNGVLVRYYCGVRKFNSTSFGLDGLLLCSIYYVPYGFYYWANVGYTMSETIYSTVAGITLCAALMFNSLALASGPAGPCRALAGTQSLYITVMSIFLLN